MQVVNKTRNVILSKDASHANTLLSRMRGLMFSKRKDIVLDHGFDDIPSSMIHMVFMKFPIDVIWIDGNMTVVDLMKGVQPFNPVKPRSWRIYKPEKPARYVVELGRGKLGTTQIGDKIELNKND